MRVLVAVAAILFLSVSAFGQSITGVTGEISDGASITIAGSSFGTKSPAAPLFWETFESGTNGARVGTPDVGTYLRNIAEVYSTTDPYSGSMCAVVERSAAVVFAGLGASINGPASACYSNWKVSIDPIDMIGPGNVKFSFINSGSNSSNTICGNTGTDNIYWPPSLNIGSNRGSTAFVPLVNQSASDGCQSYAPGIPGYPGADSEWVSVEQGAIFGTAGVADGTAMYSLGPHKWSSNSEITNCPTGAVCEGYYTAHFMPYFSLEGGPSVTIRYDNLYADDTMARVFIGNASTWATSTVIDPQIPSAWSSSSITATVNVGSYSPGTTAWLYVADADNNISSGYPITIGGESGNPSAPGRPQNMSAVER